MVFFMSDPQTLPSPESLTTHVGKDPLSMENKRVHGLLTGKMDSCRPKAFISQANKLAPGSIIMTTVTYGAKKVGERVNKTVCGLPTGITVN